MSNFESLILYFGCFFLSTIFINYWGKRSSIIYLILGLLPPVLMAAMRYWVGTDSITYLQIFERVKNYDLSEIFTSADSEGGFSLLIKIASYFGGREWFYGLSALCVLLPAAFALKKDYSEYPIGFMWLLFMISTYMNSYNLMRQSIAIAVIFWSARYLIQNDLKRFLLTVFVASLFHFSAIIFAPCYWLRKSDKFFDSRQILVLVILIIALFNLSIFFNLDTDIEAINKYSNYIQENDRANNREFFLNLFFCLVFVLNHRKLGKIDKRANLYLYFSVVAVAIGITGFMSPFIKRVAFYFSVFNIPLSCMLIKSFSGNMRSYVKIFILTYYIGRFIVVSYILGQANLFPYNTESTFKQQYHVSYNETAISNSDTIGWRSRESLAQPGKEPA